ncbi:PREDICTED: lisH domain-containing protein FOPNL-like [Polistes dominula]|uniref:LisH domain-containing protein FOPNL-like n=1 Tax=Polistes dominula TaxID=743375 RepID=A0ABM1HW15_POLDO|nr:PREDICTED: lisH domain-containing protein FOPNL-like [Polistes dominula]
MTTEKDLVNAVRESLEASGELGRIRAEMRTEVFKLLDNSNSESKLQNSKQSSDIVIFNELVREYLDWMGFKYSSTVFVSECDLSKHPYDRTLLAQTLGIKETDTSKKLPLLCGIIETLKHMKNT